MKYIYNTKCGISQVRENEFSLSKWSGGTTQLHTLEQGFFTWGASTPRGCWNQFQGVLGKVTYVAVKGIRFSLLYPYSNQVLANGRGAGLLRCDQTGCWSGKRLRNAVLEEHCLRGFCAAVTLSANIKHMHTCNNSAASTPMVLKQFLFCALIKRIFGFWKKLVLYFWSYARFGECIGKLIAFITPSKFKNHGF